MEPTLDRVRILEMASAACALGLIIKEKKRLQDDYSKDKIHAIFMAGFTIFSIMMFFIISNIDTSSVQGEILILGGKFVFDIVLPLLYILNRYRL